MASSYYNAVSKSRMERMSESSLGVGQAMEGPREVI